MSDVTISDIETDDHSTIIGGSTAERRIYCEASYSLERRIPARVKEKSSSYADEGTALHSAMEHALNAGILDPDELVGFVCPKTGIKLTQAMVDDGLAPIFDFLDALEAELESEGGIQYLAERKLAFPGVDGAFGTVDYVARTDKRSIVIDWKFGVGVEVKAKYDFPEEHVNSQPMFYATSALAELPSMFGENDDWPVDIYIAQPRLKDAPEPVFAHAQVTVGDLRDFETKVLLAIKNAKSKDAKPLKGPWCRFATCKAICPLHTGPLLDVAAMAKITVKGTKLSEINWPEVLPDLLDAADTAEAVIAKIREIAHSHLEAGDQINGWKLVAKRANRKWRDEENAPAELRRYGLKTKDIMTEPELKSPAEIDKVTKKLGITLVLQPGEDHDLITKNSSGTTLAREEDNRADITNASQVVARLGQKLAALSGK